MEAVLGTIDYSNELGLIRLGGVVVGGGAS